MRRNSGKIRQKKRSSGRVGDVVGVRREGMGLVSVADFRWEDDMPTLGLAVSSLTTLLAAWFVTTDGGEALTTPDNRGTKFMLGFLQNYGGGSQLELYITGASADRASVTITAPYANYTHHLTVTDSAVQVVTLPQSLSLSGSEKARKGVRVTADKEIIVYGVNKKEHTTDGFLGLPVDIMGTEYIVASYVGISDSPSAFGVFGIENDTALDITLRGPAQCEGVAYPDGSVVRLVLNEFDAVQCRATDTSDLTGTRITSDKPVSLMSGVKCANVPYGVGACDHIVEQIPPVNTWGRHFVTVPLAGRHGGDIFRIVSASDGTIVHATGHFPRLLDSGDVWELDVSSNTYQSITSSQPVMVLQYCKGQGADEVDSDPFMMYIPPTEQFAADYTFATVDASRSVFTNYVNIVIRTNESAGIIYDGSPLPPSTAWTEIPGADFSATQLNITTTGTHKIKHNSASVTFATFYYGFSSHESVGFPLGLRLENVSDQCQITETVWGDGVDNDCDKRVDEELLDGRQDKMTDDDGDGLIDEDVTDCINTNGSYKCTCQLGVNGDVKFCWTIDDDCRSTPCTVEHQECVKNGETFTCECAVGYYYAIIGTKDHCRESMRFVAELTVVKIGGAEQNFRAELGDTESEDFKGTASTVKNALDEHFEASSLGGRYKGVNITSFRAGSLVVRFDIYLSQGPASASTVTEAFFGNLRGDTFGSSQVTIVPSSVKIYDAANEDPLPPWHNEPLYVTLVSVGCATALTAFIVTLICCYGNKHSKHKVGDERDESNFNVAFVDDTVIN
ncbi:FCGBP [Branchiostoma lanceolatum]|uniref:FCGBP protein n=1 Tax=Branchiostoma lanceolatum TaxID=7740 RepID=A0A8K0ESW3_BRALA|nr:FCGBP [Branchiostoma lanceolatum]